MHQRYILPRYPKSFWIGLLIYAASFFIPAISGAGVTSSSGSVPGYACAWYAFTLPFNGFGGYFNDRHLEYFSLLASGWINPIFVLATILALSGLHKRLLATFRIVVLLIIPFCWIVYFEERSYPREGHLLWIVGMLIVLFSHRLTGSKEVSALIGPE